MLEESAELCAAFDLASWHLQCGRIVGVGNRKRHVAFPLVRSLFVIMGDELSAQMMEMLLTTDDEMIQALGAECLNEAFADGIHVWRHRADTFHLGTLGLDDGVEEMRDRDGPVVHRHRGVASLLRHPLAVRMNGRIRDDHSAGAVMK